ncbi:MAG: glycosyl transferase [Methanobacterium sp. Maddingley MBC34]|nr:MAG: glycosyl transferase [Methanobacterium sp. Maddingley MBC34]
MAVLVTVGIVSKNEENYIGNTLESIIGQNFNEFEIIVVDGNSQDKTIEIAEEVLNKSDIPHKILNEAHFGSYGLCFARNLVIDHSNPNSRYIAYTDADCIVNEKWLDELYQAVKGSEDKIVGAGGPRLIATPKNKKELVINTFITSFIGSGGNPAFVKRNLKFIDSIPNYNSIYKKDIISDFRYDEKLIFSDDNELNFRLKKAGYIFRYVPTAKVYHRETDSIVQFARNMYSYGFNITNTIRKHHRMVKVPLPLTILFLFYLILLMPLYLLMGILALLPLTLYFIFALMVFLEVIYKSRTLLSLMVLLLLPVQHMSYALGVIYNFYSK